MQKLVVILAIGALSAGSSATPATAQSSEAPEAIAQAQQQAPSPEEPEEPEDDWPEGLPRPTPDDSPPPEAARWQLAPHVLVSIPFDEFENVSETGAGIGLRASYRLTRAVSIRGDVAFLSYGESYDNVVIDPELGAFVAETNNQNYRLALGPQLAFWQDRFAAYAGAQAGMYYFRTTVTVSTGFDTHSDSRDNNFAFGWSVGGGVHFDVGIGPWIDLGVDYVTMYDLPGPPVQSAASPSGFVAGEDITANELGIRAGVSFFLENGP